MYIYICVYVCVKHPNRCKTCTLIYLSSRGVVGILGVNPQRRHSKFAVICNLDADCRYLRSLLQPAKLRTGKTICFSTSCLDCWRNLNFNEDHVRILLMGSLCTDEGDKFGLHSSLLAQLKTGFGASGLFVYFLLDTSMMAFHLWSFQLSGLTSVTKTFFCTPDAFHITIR